MGAKEEEGAGAEQAGELAPPLMMDTCESWKENAADM